MRAEVGGVGGPRAGVTQSWWSLLKDSGKNGDDGQDLGFGPKPLGALCGEGNPNLWGQVLHIFWKVLSTGGHPLGGYTDVFQFLAFTQESRAKSPDGRQGLELFPEILSVRDSLQVPCRLFSTSFFI